MLLRRLGATLGMAEPGRPLGGATPVATSATLGTGDTASAELADFAGKVFGVEFPPESVIGETRQTVDEACKPVDFTLPIPDAAEVALLQDLDDVAVAFCVDPDSDEVSPLFGPGSDDDDADDTRVLLGDKLLAHPLTRAVLVAVGDRPRSWPSAVKEILERAPQWGRTYQVDPDSVERALAQYLWLLSEARRRGAAGPLPLFGAEIQLWIREVSRLLRTVDPEP